CCVACVEQDHAPVLAAPVGELLEPERVAVEGDRLVEVRDGENYAELHGGATLPSERWPGSAPARSSASPTTGDGRRSRATSRAGGTRVTDGSSCRGRSAGAGTSTSPRSRAVSICAARVRPPGCPVRG